MLVIRISPAPPADLRLSTAGNDSAVALVPAWGARDNCAIPGTSTIQMLYTHPKSKVLDFKQVNE
jgi:hypothetical protein